MNYVIKQFPEEIKSRTLKLEIIYVTAQGNLNIQKCQDFKFILTKNNFPIHKSINYCGFIAQNSMSTRS